MCDRFYNFVFVVFWTAGKCPQKHKKNEKIATMKPRPGGQAQAAQPGRQGSDGRVQAAGPRRQGSRRQGHSTTHAARPGGRVQSQGGRARAGSRAPRGRAQAAGPRRQGPGGKGPGDKGPGGRATAGPTRHGGRAQPGWQGSGPRRQGPRRQGPGGRAQAAVPLKQTRAQKTKERWAWEVRLSPVRQRLSPKALCRRKAEAAAQPRTAWRNPEKRKKGQKNSDDAALKIRFSKSCRLYHPKKQTPLHEERRGGPQNSIFEIMTLGPPKGAGEAPGRSRHAMASRGRVQPET